MDDIRVSSLLPYDTYQEPEVAAISDRKKRKQPHPEAPLTAEEEDKVVLVTEGSEAAASPDGDYYLPGEPAEEPETGTVTEPKLPD